MLGSLSGRLGTSLDIVNLDCLRYAVKATIGGGLSDQLLHSKNWGDNKTENSNLNSTLVDLKLKF